MIERVGDVSKIKDGVFSCAGNNIHHRSHSLATIIRFHMASNIIGLLSEDLQRSF